jgi:hypothetical protein
MESLVRMSFSKLAVYLPYVLRDFFFFFFFSKDTKKVHI